MTIDIEKLPRTRAEAAALGLTHYFTGKPCNRGHIAWRYVSTGHCVQCLAEKKKRERLDACKKKRWNALNAKRMKKVYELNRDSINAKAKARYTSDPEPAKARSRKWRSQNRDHSNKIARSYCARRRAQKIDATLALFPVTAEVIAERLALTDGCCYCGSDAPKELEHVVALNAGGFHIPSNLLGACKSCNASKCDRPVEEWFRAQPFFSEQRWQLIQELTNG